MAKTLDEYMELPYRMEIVEDKDEGGFVVSYPDLPGCITCGESIESAIEASILSKSSSRGVIISPAISKAPGLTISRSVS